MIINMLEDFPDVVGIFGVLLLLIAYGLLNTNKLSAHSIKYQVLNFSGAGGILFSLFFDWNTSAVVIEIAWMLISLIGIYNIIRKRKRHKKANLYPLEYRENKQSQQ